MALQFERIDVTSWEVVNEETAGAEEKWWLADEGGVRWLFKPVTLHESHRQGEDWAEKLSSHVASESLDLPVAAVELAVRGGFEGSISRNIRPDEFALQPGYLAMIDHPIVGYQPGNVPGRPGHSVENIRTVLDPKFDAPPSNLPSNLSAFDVFAGYLLLDALISNRDRHDENWSVLYPGRLSIRPQLSPTYDQAGSLGYNLRDIERADRIGGARGGIRGWAERGTAWRFEHDPKGPIETLVELAGRALDLCTETGAEYWRSALGGIDAEELHAYVRACTEMSEAESTFAIELLDINLGRLCDECI